MKNLGDIFTAELKNLYAMEKQMEEALDGLGQTKHEKLGKRIEKFKKLNSAYYIKVQSLLQTHAINPGNTTDSVANEILLNLSEIDSSSLKPAVKNAGLLASMLRLVGYQYQNYENAYRMAKALKMKKTRKKLNKIRKSVQNQRYKLDKLAKKSVFKEAV